jgi:hypothetical protein
MAEKTQPAQFTEDTLLIRENEVPVRIGYIEHTKLKFYVENPRIYSIVRTNDTEPSQDEIETALQDMDHVKILKGDIEQNGGLVDAIFVKDGTFDVIEGNSRLAAYRLLAKQDPIRWGSIKCQLLPASIDDSLISSLLGQYHLKGKKEWPPYEQAGFLHRRYYKHKIEMKDLAAEMSETQVKVRQYIETYQFMIDRNDNKPNRWSYYLEYLKNKKIQDASKRFADFEPLIVGMIKSEDFDNAQDMRDKLPVVCQAPKVLKKFVSGKVTFEEAFEEAEESGIASEPFLKLHKFRNWLVSEAAQNKIINSKPPSAGKIKYEVDTILNEIKRLADKLNKRN